jgi:ligand-binding SRPBCC domain-containing protein
MTVDRSLGETFAFFEDPRNLSRITPDWLRFTIKTAGVEMRRGAEIDYTIRWLGLPMKWRTLITGYEPPHSFEDSQIKGPYRLWVHRHTFEAAGQGTLVRDSVRYSLPLGGLGLLTHAIAVRRQLEGIFVYRQKTLAVLLGEYPETRELPTIQIFKAR